MTHRYEDLVVWQKAMALVLKVYKAAENFPQHERYGLSTQICRAAVSVPSNIAEGQGRATRGEFRQFLGHARGSLFEVETQMRLAGELGFVSRKDTEGFFEASSEVARLLNGLLTSLERSTGNRKLETGN